jgi:hypothetical protein
MLLIHILNNGNANSRNPENEMFFLDPFRYTMS